MCQIDLLHLNVLKFIYSHKSYSWPLKINYLSSFTLAFLPYLGFKPHLSFLCENLKLYYSYKAKNSGKN